MARDQFKFSQPGNLNIYSFDGESKQFKLQHSISLQTGEANTMKFSYTPYMSVVYVDLLGVVIEL